LCRVPVIRVTGPECLTSNHHHHRLEMHPQLAIHELSLLNRLESNGEWSNDAKSFWLHAAKGLNWFKSPRTAYGPSTKSSGKDVWFPDGVLNTCYEALDRYCIPTPSNPNASDRPCLHCVSSMPEAAERPSLTLSYGEVLEKVKALAGVLRNRMGVKEGDTVVIYSSSPGVLYSCPL